MTIFSVSFDQGKSVWPISCNVWRCLRCQNTTSKNSEKTFTSFSIGCEKPLWLEPRKRNWQLITKQTTNGKSGLWAFFIFMSFRFSDLAHILGENSRLPEPDNGLSPITEESLSSTARWQILHNFLNSYFIVFNTCFFPHAIFVPMVWTFCLFLCVDTTVVM